MKYFSNCQNISDLRKEYLKLIKKYHPDLAKDQPEIERLNKICSEINNEYELLCSRLPKNKVTQGSVYHRVHDYVIDGNEEAKSACDEIADRISKLPIDYNFYHVHDGAQWWEDQVANEMDTTVEIFWSNCFAKKITGSEFARLFELCDSNVEKMRRAIMFLSTGAISERDIHTNLTSNSAIPFFDDSITVESLPGYNSFLLLSKETTKRETMDAWIEFCQRQRDSFSEKFYDIVVPKISSGKQK